ncbi:MAG: response regulator [Candidatus Rokubacteria bacterium]|nr:response regulator [Candidatus Rokubacteria bacterium]
MPRILVADDDRTSRELTAELLQNAGHTVSQASSARETIARCKASLPDLVLLDLILPDRTGIDLLGELKALWPGLPVIIVTGYPEIRSVVEAMRRGAAEYLVKPVDPDALVRACDAALAGGPHLPGPSRAVTFPLTEETQGPAWPPPLGAPKPLREVVAAYIDHVIAATHGNKARAARLLGISRETLRARLTKGSRPACSPWAPAQARARRA